MRMALAPGMDMLIGPPRRQVDDDAQAFADGGGGGVDAAGDDFGDVWGGDDGAKDGGTGEPAEDMQENASAPTPLDMLPLPPPATKQQVRWHHAARPHWLSCTTSFAGKQLARAHPP
jgi:hypothetical protein